MIPRDIRLPPEHLFPAFEWGIVEAEFSGTWMGNAETIFSLSNGYLGMRGTFEEGRPAIEPGSFINGFHETWPIVHAEEAYGFARTGQTIVNVPDATLMKLYVDDEPLFLPTARITDYERCLDFREGVLRRDMNWSTPGGKQVRIGSTRIVSLAHRHLGAIQYELEVDEDAPVVISSQVLNRQDSRPLDEPSGNGELDPRRSSGFGYRVLRSKEQGGEGHRLLAGHRTTNSRMTLGTGVDHVVETDNPWRAQRSITEDLGKVVFTIDAKAGTPILITKFFSYHTSRTVPPAELIDRCARSLDRSVRDGYPSLEAAQRSFLDDFWARADVQVDGPPRVQQAIRWNIFQLCQAAARAETTGIPAKGLTGQAYEGHYFWDTEVYVAPFLTYTDARITRNLLRFRHSMLPASRDRAAEMSEDGALFPWRTINGEEASSYYAAGTAQYHIDADVAYAIKRYVDVRGDRELLKEVGAEILVETARLWAGLGFFGGTGAFHIHGVTGPDEYTTVVNDNAFTNLMARHNLRYAAEIVLWLREEDAAAYGRLVHATDLEDDEPAAWQRAADAMYIPYDAARGIHPQDVNFLEKERWDFENTPNDEYPLLLNYHPLVIYRHQVIKQADVVLAMVLLGNEFSLEQKRRNFDYYDPLTTGDSSLSACVQSILAAEIGYEDKALEYFQYALLMDLANVAGNVVDGVHVASVGGVWMTLVYGFGGLRDFDGELSFDPRLPRGWEALRFRLRFHDRQIAIDLDHERFRFELLEGEPLTITVRDRELSLEVDAPLQVPADELPAGTERLASDQPSPAPATAAEG
jgi:alpha,alpha-trehalose phosphorylase